ncbi:RTA1-domain-containing protein [Epithele typhae]|uniref:RTA1-domain-containing protein n=1 Tax=Epithele typhae TaxID=378194 RepID=UPI002007AF7D|nr:RTA1-domain-containing protein [Epithele typhae]KAH9945094.1 RTA1-domain-containing protein [Epithele typhae]
MSRVGDATLPIEYDSHGHLISPFYGYWPTQYVCFIYVALFGLATLLHLGQAIRYRTWWLLPTAVLAGVGETIGWGGRLWSSYQPLVQNPFLIQIVCTIVSATPLVGALFISFGRLVVPAGEQYSRLSPRLYGRIFLTVDFIALVVQSAGGGLAATAESASGSKLGSNIMLAGIVFQLIFLVMFAVLAMEYFWRLWKDVPIRPARLQTTSSDSTQYESSPQGPMEKPLKQLAEAICLMTILLLIRAVYRTIELADGWDGKVIQTEIYFDIFDGAMITLAMYTLSLAHPGRLLRDAARLRAWGKIPPGFKQESSSVV